MFWRSISSYAALSIFSYTALGSDVEHGTQELFKAYFEEPKNYLGQEICQKTHKGKNGETEPIAPKSIAYVWDVLLLKWKKGEHLMSSHLIGQKPICLMPLQNLGILPSSHIC